MKSQIIDAIETSIKHDSIEHIILKDVDNIFDAFEGVKADDYVEIEPGLWDVWGADDNLDHWRLSVRILA